MKLSLPPEVRSFLLFLLGLYVWMMIFGSLMRRDCDKRYVVDYVIFTKLFCEVGE